MVNFIILGAQKAATSALQASLKKHPLIYMPEGESPFFEEPDYQQSPWLSFANDKSSDVIKGIKRPDYLCSDIAIKRILDALPESKFIVVLREPVSRAISSYCYMVRHAHLPAKPLNEGMKSCLEAYEQGVNNRASSVITYGLYGKYLTKWYQAYDRERFIVFSQEQVRSKLEQVLMECMHHLGIFDSQSYSDFLELEDSNVGLYDPDLLKIARIASLIKTKPILGSERRIPRVLPLRMLGGVVSRYSEYVARKKGQKKEVLNEDLLTKLNEIYQQDSVLLKHLVNASKFSWIEK